jgi:branched-subunit amino acid ABC-type transport system permease component
MAFELIELTLRGLFLGVTIGLVALPISLLFLTTDSVDLAVGPYAVLAGATALLVGGLSGMLLGVLAAVGASVIVAIISLRLSRPGKQEPIMAVLATFGAAFFLESFVLTYYGQNAIVRQPFDMVWSISGIRISPQVAINMAVALGILGILSAVLYASPFGRAMRASAINPIGASLAGVPVRAVWFTTYILGGLLAGVAGILILNTTGMDYSQGLGFTLGAFGAAILFGLKSPLRAFAGGIGMGLVQAWSAGYLPGAWATAVPLIFIFLVLSGGRMDRAAFAGSRA